MCLCVWFVLSANALENLNICCFYVNGVGTTDNGNDDDKPWWWCTVIRI